METNMAKHRKISVDSVIACLCVCMGEIAA